MIGTKLKALTGQKKLDALCSFRQREFDNKCVQKIDKSDFIKQINAHTIELTKYMMQFPEKMDKKHRMAAIIYPNTSPNQCYQLKEKTQLKMSNRSLDGQNKHTNIYLNKQI